MATSLNKHIYINSDCLISSYSGVIKSYILEPMVKKVEHKCEIIDFKNNPLEWFQFTLNPKINNIFVYLREQNFFILNLINIFNKISNKIVILQPHHSIYDYLYRNNIRYSSNFILPINDDLVQNNTQAKKDTIISIGDQKVLNTDKIRYFTKDTSINKLIEKIKQSKIFINTSGRNDLSLLAMLNNTLLVTNQKIDNFSGLPGFAYILLNNEIQGKRQIVEIINNFKKYRSITNNGKVESTKNIASIVYPYWLSQFQK